ncbi:MAG: CPBP family intramembrane metalloprotease [Ilumatobacteraceae bacterium]|nr:CPBP family intramembrane metalloprotease [Ilumatobacteraceae bacterium]
MEHPRIPFSRAVVVWGASYIVSNILALLLFSISGLSKGEPTPIWLVAATSLALWVPIVAGVQFLGNRFGLGNIRHDFGIIFSWRDAWGVPAGVASQLLLVTAVTWPFTQWFPDQFSSDKIEQRARDLIDVAHGGWIIVLALIVIIGAPFVEELTYRGLLQGSLARLISPRIALVIIAAFFAVIHLSVVEIPGLFVFAIVLGLMRERTGALGLCMVTHAAFNATGLVLLALT